MKGCPGFEDLGHLPLPTVDYYLENLDSEEGQNLSLRIVVLEFVGAVNVQVKTKKECVLDANEFGGGIRDLKRKRNPSIDWK